MIKSMIIAFSTYSRIPMPKVEWNEKSMKYSMCYFSFVGAVIGGINLLLLYLLKSFEVCTDVFSTILLTVLPVFITGGIHMDGFMDTVDAKSSYKPVEDKLKILKDPHSGAFAIIYSILYMLIYFGAMYEMVTKTDEITYVNVAYAMSFVYVRILSGLSVVFLKKAKKDGMLYEVSEAADKKVKWILSFELLACILLLIAFDIFFNIWVGAVIVCIGIISFIWYRHMAYKTFGGITGDLAGYFLQMTELLILIGVAVWFL